MAREELVEGIKQAVRKGESLRDVMMSFYNAGYPKEEIEEAAKIVYSGAGTYSPGSIINNGQTEIRQEVRPDRETPFAPKTTQKVSEYSTSKKVKMNFAKKVFLIFLFIFLFLIGGLILALIVFKEEFVSIVLGG